MSEKSGGEIPIRIINNVSKDLHKQPITDKAIEVAQMDGNVVDENSKEGRLNALLGDKLHGKSPDDKADLSLYGKIFNNPDQQDKQQRITKYKEELLYPTVLIDKNHIPESDFNLQLKIARERGQTGLVDTSQEARKITSEIIYNDQKKSLDNWVDYLSSTDAIYPTWFKYYSLTSVSKMGVYDKAKHEFSKRTKDTTTMFPDLNREALAYTYDVLKQRYIKHEKHNDEELNKILDTANFSKIYAFAIDKVTPASKENKEKTEGEWTKFDKGHDHTALYESLQGHGTGWCTAGEETAKSQLQGGDFYVYYSKDENSKYTIPRIAIRMEGDQVGEVRGIDPNQNMEANMVDIAKEKYHSLPGGEKFDKKDADMKQLTLIDNKVNKNQELSKDEIKFLYEVDNKIEGFGYQADPRIKEIRDKRIPKLDAPIVFDCQPSEIAWSREELNSETKAYLGPLFPGIFKDYKNIENIYTSFPEGKISRESLNVGGKSVEQLELELKQNKINISGRAEQMMNKSEFITLKSPEVFDLIHLKISDLGFTFNNQPTTEELYETAKQFGLEPCPPEVGPELRLKDKDQSLYEYKYIAIKPITDSDGSPCLFRLEHSGNGLWLLGYWVHPDACWGLNSGMIFSLRKLES